GAGPDGRSHSRIVHLRDLVATGGPAENRRPMRLAPKLTLLLAAAGAGPLLGVTALTLPASRDALRRQLDARNVQDARALAELVDAGLRERIEALSLSARPLPLAKLDPET